MERPHADHLRTITHAVDDLESGAETAVSLLHDCLQRIDDHGDDAIFISFTKERAEMEAAASDARRRSGKLLSALDGVPVAWKDLFDTKGVTTTAGAAVRADSPPAARDADVVGACAALGMVCIGKTNLSEFAYSGLGLNPHFGTPKNPRAAEADPRAPGGSSSGSAVAVAAGLVPVAVGTDTAGSVRVPASFCGVTGYKASQNRYSKAGVFALSDSLDSLGIFAHSVDDVMAMDAVMRGQLPGPPDPTDIADLEIVIPQTVVFDDVAPDILTCFEAAVGQLEKAGVTITRMPFSIFAEIIHLFQTHGTLTVAEAATLHRDLLASDDAERMDQRVRQRLLLAPNFSTQDYIYLQQERVRLQTAVTDLLGHRFLLFPTVPITAPALDALEASDELFAATNLLALRNTMLGNYVGTPGVSLPIGIDRDGLPGGALLSAPYGDDDRVLAAARAIETITMQLA